jgi:hypothetical protein
MARPAPLSPRLFLGGVILGFVLCCLAGRLVSKRPMFEHFVRFHQGIDPESNFYATASELVSQVRGTIPRTKILVLVGGASYFRGAGQNADELWTGELQRLLGNNYAVVNFASDGAGITAFAGVAFQVLAQEYPRIICVSSGSPVSPDPIDGGAVYSYIFWDAYYKGMIPLPAPWSDQIRALASLERRDPATQELHLGRWIDSFSYGCDLWNYVGYKYFFTVWGDNAQHSPFLARRDYSDAVDSNHRQEQLDFRSNRDYAKRYEDGNRGFATVGFVRGADGAWKPIEGAFAPVADEAAKMFPAHLRSRCYIVFVRANPYFMQTFSDDDWKRLETIYLQGERAYKSAGYNVVQLKPTDFSSDDFWDGGHFMASGGRKVAKAVAMQILADNGPK